MDSLNGESVGDLRENAPLSGSKRGSWFPFLSCNEDSGGSKLITISFAVITFAITIALVIQIHYGDYQIVPHGSVATDSRECSSIGIDILKSGGNAVDAAIASAFCLAIVNPHSTGLDAGGVFMIYSHRIRDLPIVIDFTNGPTSILNGIPIPTMILALANIHMNYGRMSWRDIVRPSAKLASHGFLVPSTLAEAIQQAGVESIFGRLQAGQNISITFPQTIISNYLERIADISDDDLQTFSSSKHELVTTSAIKYTFQKYNIFVPNLPTGGPILLANLKHLNEMNFSSIGTSYSQYRLAELMLDIFNELNITNENYHKGTSSNIAAIDTDDLYVTLVTGMFELFGSKIVSDEGYILDIKDSYKNMRTPIIITDQKIICGRRIVMGSGDLSTAVQIIVSLLIGEENATTSVEQPRFQILNLHAFGIEDSPNTRYSANWKKFQQELETLGTVSLLPEPYGSCNVVEKMGDSLSSHSDRRGGGIAYRF